MMDREILKAIAVAVLSEVVGPGRWCKDCEFPEFKKADSPVKGLSVGDVVYAYNDDDEEIEEQKVIAVVDGIGYVLYVSHYYGPILAPVTDDSYGRTIAEAGELAREQIESSIKFSDERHERMNKVKRLLGWK